RRLECLLHGGDDYELIFTAAPGDRERVQAAARASQTPVHRIGCITPDAGQLRLIGTQGQTMAVPTRGFDHFT
ncbi:MAG: thiamine-phosphate kinase, partial [Hydrogenophaga sp.]|nr:thiamine-phosphate kinase [Hydrogenophaga sp.]